MLAVSCGSGHAFCIASTPATIAALGRQALVGQFPTLAGLAAPTLRRLLLSGSGLKAFNR
ncbi:protein of unknown function [Paraburkholderia kururiensis]